MKYHPVHEFSRAQTLHQWERTYGIDNFIRLSKKFERSDNRVPYFTYIEFNFPFCDSKEKSNYERDKNKYTKKSRSKLTPRVVCTNYVRARIFETLSRLAEKHTISSMWKKRWRRLEAQISATRIFFLITTGWNRQGTSTWNCVIRN